MMGHGTYARLWESVWYHPKTMALARAFTSHLRVPERWARQEVVHQFHRLLCWCMRESDTGQVGHLTADMFGRIVDWDDPKTRKTLLEIWRSSGFLDVRSPDDVLVHDWDMNMTEALRKRRDRARSKSGQRPDKDARNDNGQRPDNVRTTSGRAADKVRTSRARSECGIRKAEDGSACDDSVLTRRTEPPAAEGAPPAGVAACEPQPNRNPALRAFETAWAEAYGIPHAWASPGHAAKEAAGVMRQLGLDAKAPADVERWASACRRFCADRSQRIVEQRHPWAWFLRGAAGYLAGEPMPIETEGAAEWRAEQEDRGDLSAKVHGYDAAQSLEAARRKREEDANRFRIGVRS